jgi:hypothetical protein
VDKQSLPPSPPAELQKTSGVEIIPDSVRQLDAILNARAARATTDNELTESLRAKVITKRWLLALPVPLLDAAARAEIVRLELHVTEHV